jgi:hypothetical protein
MRGFSDLHSTGSTSLGWSVVAFLVAPLLSCLLVVSGVLLWFLWGVPGGEHPPSAGEQALLFAAMVLWATAAMGAALSYTGMALVGVPAWVLLRFTNNESGIAYTAIGAAGGWLIGPALGGHKWAGFPMDVAGAAGGGLALLLFWCIARRH